MTWFKKIFCFIFAFIFCVILCSIHRPNLLDGITGSQQTCNSFIPWRRLLQIFISSMSPDHYDVVYISKVRRYPVNGRYRRQGVFNGYDVFKHEALQRYLYHVGYYWLIGDIHNNQFPSTYLRVRDVTRDPDKIRNAWEEKGRNRRWQRNDYLEVDCSGENIIRKNVVCFCFQWRP